MANGTFQPGTWYRLPPNCTSGFWLTYMRCAEYGQFAFVHCQQWITTTVVDCIKWGWETVRKCSWWSFLFCVLWAVIVSVVCLAFGILVITGCAIFAVIIYTFCLIWTVFTFWFCVASANGGTAFVLTDGSLMMQESNSFFGFAMSCWGTRRWWKLTPDQFGGYEHGTWSRLADSNVARTFYASGVLADGRIVMFGGEYSDASGQLSRDWTNTCEVYDPVADAWTAFAPPTRKGTTVPWKGIGDAPGAVLPDGTFLLGSILYEDLGDVAKLDPVTLTWTSVDSRGENNQSAEESWVLMPNDTVVSPNNRLASTAWVYRIAADNWVSYQGPPVSIIGPEDIEIGPGLLLYDGRAFWIGANDDKKATAMYSPLPGPTWTNGPELPEWEVDGRAVKIGIHDGPGSLMVNGNVLFCAGERRSRDYRSEPCWFWEFDGTEYHRTTDPETNDCVTFITRLLLLPNGDVLFSTMNDSRFCAYHSETAQPQDSWRPVIQNCPTIFPPGATIQISGLQFNGLSQAVGYGDDSQTATNYPLVRIVNTGTGHVRYCRTFNHTKMDGNGNIVPSMGVATGSTVITTNVHIPPDIELGQSQLFVVANGIPSVPFGVTVGRL